MSTRYILVRIIFLFPWICTGSYGVSITTQLQQSTVPMSDALPPSHDMLSGPPQQKSKYSPQQDEDMLLRLLVANNYENRLRPGPKGNPRGPLKVNVSLHIVNIGPVSEFDMTFKLGVYFRQFWVDSRLQFNGNKSVTLSEDLLDALWLPDSFFHSEIVSNVHKVTKENVFFRIEPNGEILMSIRATVTSRCPMNLRYFPMDTQVCELRIASYGYTCKDVIYQWHWRDIIAVENDTTLANFRMINYTLTNFNRSLSTGSWSTLAVQFTFVRNTLYFFIQMYAPSALIVMVSWVSFWVGTSSVPARAALGITTVLTLLTIITGSNNNMPKISYMKAIDVYFAGCFFFVFCSLIEFAMVCYLNVQRGIYDPEQAAAYNYLYHNNSDDDFVTLPHSYGEERSPYKLASKKKRNSLVSEKPSFRNSSSSLHRKPSVDSAESNAKVISPKKSEKYFSFNLFTLLCSCRNSSDNQASENCLSHNVDLIDTYSRYLFPLSYLILNLMYWYFYKYCIT
ncbi:gamma-aminobutyric acid receptor subunit pi-like [Symsagittifera roscoffensis]|uniref:gamma-aminobutyric acid receptor subunit pi-like n=1 Tax=Symsagittifera roscoffensis TaxID=84072 RepID=UPI00307C1532